VPVLSPLTLASPRAPLPSPPLAPAQEKDGYLPQSVKTLDLRNVREQAFDARRKIASERRSALATMGGAPQLRPMTASSSGGGPRASVGGGATTTLRIGRPSGAAASSSSSSSSAKAQAQGGPSSPSAADSMAAAAASAAVMEVAQLHAKVSLLEDALIRTAKQFGAAVAGGAADGGQGAGAGEFYSVSFGPGAIGASSRAEGVGAWPELSGGG
jgi:hypothetical protein